MSKHSTDFLENGMLWKTKRHICFIGGSMSGGQSESNSSSESGMSLLPPELQKAFNQYANRLNTTFASPDDSRFTPLAKTAGETSAINNINKGFAPTADSLKSDIGMQMNPFDDSVINTINRQAVGENSALNSALSKAGQFGSNRQMLGANDIDLTRMDKIGQFKQGQFNTALQNAMTIMPDLRAKDAQAQMGAGGFERGLDAQTRQAPITSLMAYGQALGAIPQSGGLKSNSSSDSWNASAGGNV